VMAYLMSKMKFGWREACEYVQERRSVVEPNFSFVGQLWKYEGMVKGCREKCKEKFGGINQEKFGEKYPEKFAEKFTGKFSERYQDKFVEKYKDTIKISGTIKKSLDNFSQKYYDSSWSENK